MSIAYLDCSSGISGDMFLAALLDAGLPPDRLFGELKKVPLGFYEFKRTRAMRGSLVGTRVEIHVSAKQPARKFAVIAELLETSKLEGEVKAHALQVLTRLAEVEGNSTTSRRVKSTSTNSAGWMLSSTSSAFARGCTCWGFQNWPARP